MLRRHLLPLVAVLLTAGPLAAQGYHGFNPANIDRSVPPCQDFFDFAVGGWIKRTPIPAQYSRFGVDEEIEQRMNPLLRSLAEGAAKAAPGSEARKVGDFYAASMDEAAIEKAGLRPLQPLLAKVEGLKGAAGLPSLLADLHGMGLEGAHGFYVEQDDKESTRYAAFLAQDGLGLPDRDYYTDTDAKAQGLRKDYEAHVARMLSLTGMEQGAAAKAASDILAFETRLARASMTKVELRDPQATYHRMKVADLEKVAPGFDWKGYLTGLGVREAEVVVRQPGFLKEMGVMAQSVPVATWKAYLRWQVVRGTASLLPKAVTEAQFDFYGKRLRGLQTQRPRWERMLGMTDGALGQPLGKLFVEKHFPPEAKARMLELTRNIFTALRGRIEKLAWMSAPTKARALQKLDTMVVKIGYPDQWRDFSGLKVSREDFFGNVMAGHRFEFQRRTARLGKPMDRSEWGMTPATNNAYYSPTMNEICFPAGILQPPYFDLAADDAVNYGNIGATIGHELTHGFDDEGRQYDAQGNLKDWWTPEDAKAFDARAQMVVDQFNAFEPLPGQHINGKMTLGENLADLGGLRIAWEAWQLSRKGKPAVGLIEGFTPEQRFFLGYAETWRTQFRPEELANRMKTDVHSPAKWRVLAPLANMPEFFEAFGCKDGDVMKRAAEQRPQIW